MTAESKRIAELQEYIKRMELAADEAKEATSRIPSFLSPAGVIRHLLRENMRLTNRDPTDGQWLTYIQNKGRPLTQDPLRKSREQPSDAAVGGLAGSFLYPYF